MYRAPVMKKFTFMLFAVLAVLLLALPACAQSAINFTLSVEPASLPAPGPVTVSIRVVNEGDSDMTNPVLLYDPDGSIVTSFGDGGQALIKKGEYVTAQQTYNVTQAQLDAGKLTYMLSYNQVDENGQVVVQSETKSAEIAFSGTKVELTVNRVIDPEVVRNGKTVSIQYELYNAGNVEIKNIRVRENSSISGTAQTIASLSPGQRQTIQFTATMGSRDLTSEGKITYKAGTESFSNDLPAVTIARAVPGLELTDILTADKTSIENGDTVTLTLSIKNNGNITYSNITVTDAKYGEIFTNLTLGPGETLTRDKQFTLSETTAFKFTVTLPDNTGTTNTVTSNEVKVSVYDPGQVLHLNVVAATETLTVPRIPADVDFTLTVTNNSSFAAKDVALYHGDVLIYTISTLEPLQSVTITRSFSLSQAGKFRFSARAKDALNNTVSFDSNEITITYAAPTASPAVTPRPTVAPLVTVTVAPIEVLEPVTLQTNRILSYAALAFGGLFAVSFVLFIISTIIRQKRRISSARAYDHMELGEKRDYSKKAQDILTDITDSAEPIVPQTAAEPAVQPPHSEENGAYRLTRAEDTAQDAPAAEEKEAPTAAPRHPRKGRKSEVNEDE